MFLSHPSSVISLKKLTWLLSFLLMYVMMAIGKAYMLSYGTSCLHSTYVWWFSFTFRKFCELLWDFSFHWSMQGLFFCFLFFGKAGACMFNCVVKSISFMSWLMGVRLPYSSMWYSENCSLLKFLLCSSYWTVIVFLFLCSLNLSFSFTRILLTSVDFDANLRLYAYILIQKVVFPF